MYRRIIFALVCVTAVALSPPALGQGNGNGSENGQGNGNSGQGNGNSGQGNENNGNNGNGNNGQGNAGSNGNGNGNAGSGNANAGSASPNAGLAPAVPATSELSESDVLDAVQAGRAVPLATILPDIRTRTGGKVINARLEQVGEFLLYAVTVLTTDDRVTTEYYYARSGLHVER